jgi:DNA-binding NarL/FixJ family response regulator
MSGSSSGAAHAQRRETPKTILVADDDPVIREALCEMFEIEKDYDICAEAVNGQEAVAVAKKHRPDLVILDLSMPVMNGYDAAWEIRGILPSTRIILFTLYADAVKSRVLGSGSPVDLVVSKTDSANMMNQVRSLIPV